MHNGPTVTEHGTVICDTPESIQLFQLLSIKGRLKLELTGIKFHLNTVTAVNRIFKQPFPAGKNGRRKALEFIQERIDELTGPITEDPA